MRHKIEGACTEEQDKNRAIRLAIYRSFSCFIISTYTGNWKVRMEIISATVGVETMRTVVDL